MGNVWVKRAQDAPARELMTTTSRAKMSSGFLLGRNAPTMVVDVYLFYPSASHNKPLPVRYDERRADHRALVEDRAQAAMVDEPGNYVLRNVFPQQRRGAHYAMVTFARVDNIQAMAVAQTRERGQDT